MNHECMGNMQMGNFSSLHLTLSQLPSLLSGRQGFVSFHGRLICGVEINKLGSVIQRRNHFYYHSATFADLKWTKNQSVVQLGQKIRRFVQKTIQNYANRVLSNKTYGNFRQKRVKKVCRIQYGSRFCRLLHNSTPLFLFKV